MKITSMSKVNHKYVKNKSKVCKLQIVSIPMTNHKYDNNGSQVRFSYVVFVIISDNTCDSLRYYTCGSFRQHTWILSGSILAKMSGEILTVCPWNTCDQRLSFLRFVTEILVISRLHT